MSKKHPKFFVTASSAAAHKTIDNFSANLTDKSAQKVQEKSIKPLGQNLNVSSINEFEVEYDQDHQNKRKTEDDELDDKIKAQAESFESTLAANQAEVKINQES